MTATAVAIDRAAFFEALAAEMNAHPERYHLLGDADMVAAIIMRKPAGEAPFALRVVFEGLECIAVDPIDEADASQAEFALDGGLDAWSDMFADIVARGRAENEWTINSLTLIGARIRLTGDDPMGLDKFSRFNQTLQEFFDGASRLERG